MSTPYSSVADLTIGDWNAVMTDYQYVDAGDMAEYGPRIGVWEINASSDTEAEQRALRHLEYHYEDDLRGAVAESQGETEVPGRYLVHINFPAPRG